MTDLSDSTYDDTAEQYGYPAAEAQKVFGLDPAIQRSNILPYYSKQTGWVAPGALYQALKGILAPGLAARGKPVGALDALNTAGLIGSGGLAASRVTGVPEGALGMNVYHGTHQTFPPTPNNPLGEFSLDKIGSAFNGSAFGRGIYVSESPTLAEGYKVGASPKLIFSNKVVDTNNRQFWRVDAHQLANQAMHLGVQHPKVLNGSISPFAGAKLSIPWVTEGNTVSPTTIKNAKSLLTRWEKQNPQIQLGGSLYTAELPDESAARMLDWDEPMERQPRVVQNAFDRWWSNYQAKTPYPITRLPERGVDFHGLFGNSRRAAESLLEQGVPGVKYDIGTLSNPDGHNYVLFDPSIAKIIKREAKGGLVKGGGAIMQALKGAK